MYAGTLKRTNKEFPYLHVSNVLLLFLSAQHQNIYCIDEITIDVNVEEEKSITIAGDIITKIGRRRR